MATAVSDWAKNMRRLVMGRPRWTPEEEFSYYRVDRQVVLDHRARQVENARTVGSTGLRMLESLGLLDADRLRGARALDIGSGECFVSDAMVRCGATVWATDAIPKQIWAAAERHADREDFQFLIADAQNLPFADHAFDFVTANLVLHHIEPLDSLLQEIHRVLRPGGQFVALEPTPLIGALIHEATSANEAPISTKAVARALAANGFESIEVTYFWSRLRTSALGPLSPAYRVAARKAGPDAARAVSPLRRAVRPMKLAGLSIDEGCAFAELAHTQENEILRVLAEASLAR